MIFTVKGIHKEHLANLPTWAINVWDSSCVLHYISRRAGSLRYWGMKGLMSVCTERYFVWRSYENLTVECMRVLKSSCKDRRHVKIIYQMQIGIHSLLGWFHLSTHFVPRFISAFLLLLIYSKQEIIRRWSPFSPSVDNHIAHSRLCHAGDYQRLSLTERTCYEAYSGQWVSWKGCGQTLSTAESRELLLDGVFMKYSQVIL